MIPAVKELPTADDITLRDDWLGACVVVVFVVMLAFLESWNDGNFFEGGVPKP